MFSEYSQFDAMELAALARRGEVSAQELLDAALARAAACNPQLNVLIHSFADRARQQIIDGLPEGPFQGVPFVLKDLMAMFAGEPICMGSRALSYTPRYDSELVKRYKAAGLNIFAKSNTPEFGLIITTEPKRFGPSHNPHRQGYSTGGSSGGSAAAVAAGIVPIAHGGDGGGSIRFPASWCGVFGLKPSRGRNPMGPDLGEDWQGAVAEHVLSRTVRDSAAMLDCTAGPELGAPYNIRPPEGSFLAAAERDPKPLRIALCREPLVPTDVDPEVLTGLEKTAEQLAALGHRVEEAELSVDRDQMWRDFLVIVGAEVAGLLRRIQRDYPGSDIRRCEPSTKNLAMMGRSFSAADLVEARYGWHKVQRAAGELMADYDVILCPTTPTAAVPHGQLPPSPWEAAQMLASHRMNIGRALMRSGMVEKMALPVLGKMAYTLLGNITGLPCMSVPLHKTSTGLPFGMQFIAGMCEEELLFSLAGQLEREVGFTDLPLLA
ncbi:MAG: amidase [Spongiibacter marinus]|uniref:amidase n=1 Tax=Spongiibacter marinus TaxID=354246 RepID=UPI003C47E1FB